jgi:hypothetical protein
MYLRLMPNFLHFLPDLDALYALCCTPNFHEIHPWMNEIPEKARQTTKNNSHAKKRLFKTNL